MMRKLATLCSALLIFTSSHATTFHVPADRPTIQLGIDRAAVGDTVLVDCGVYYEYAMEMKAGITLLSATGEADCVTIDAQSLDRVMNCTDEGPPFLVKGFTLANGRFTAGGAGFFVSGGDHSFVNCRFAGNIGFEGPGCAVVRSTVSFEHCLFDSNGDVSTFGRGGAVGIFEASPVFDHCVFWNNESRYGGAVYIADSSDQAAEFNHCTFVGNRAQYGSFAYIFGFEARMELSYSIVSFGREGSVMAGEDLQLSVVCCDIYGNDGGDWTGPLAPFQWVGDNFSENPFFCDEPAGDLHVAVESPCVPAGNDCGALIGALGEGCILTATSESSPVGFSLAQNSPNPFNPTTEIQFNLVNAAEVSLAIHDLSGRMVCDLISGRVCDAGHHSVVWNGNDTAGHSLPSGVYFYRLRAGSYAETRKMTLLK